MGTETASPMYFELLRFLPVKLNNPPNGDGNNFSPSDSL